MEGGYQCDLVQKNVTENNGSLATGKNVVGILDSGFWRCAHQRRRVADGHGWMRRARRGFDRAGSVAVVKRGIRPGKYVGGLDINELVKGPEPEGFRKWWQLVAWQIEASHL